MKKYIVETYDANETLLHREELSKFDFGRKLLLLSFDCSDITIAHFFDIATGESEKALDVNAVRDVISIWNYFYSGLYNEQTLMIKTLGVEFHYKIEE